MRLWIVYVNKYAHDGAGVARELSRHSSEAMAERAKNKAIDSGLYRFVYVEAVK